MKSRWDIWKHAGGYMCVSMCLHTQMWVWTCSYGCVHVLCMLIEHLAKHKVVHHLWHTPHAIMSSKKVNGLPGQDNTDKAMMTCYLHFIFHLFWSFSGVTSCMCVCVWEERVAVREVPSWCVCSKSIICFLFFLRLVLALCIGCAAGRLIVSESGQQPSIFQFHWI